MTEPTASASPAEHRLVVVTAGTSDPSSTRMLADRAAKAVADLARADGAEVRVDVIELRPLTTEIGEALTTQVPGPGLQRAIGLLAEAEGLVVATPVYKADPSALFTAFFQVLDQDLLIGVPVVLTATAGTERHALVVDHQMRATFAYLRTMAVPTSLFAAPDDWQGSGLGRRIDRAALELWLLMRNGIQRQLRESSWSSYQHQFGSAGGTEFGVDFSSDLMRLAAGGSLPPRGA